MACQRIVLLVEDNEKLNDINRRALEMKGYNVITAFTLAEARTYLMSCVPDVILLDVALPDGSGFDFCTEIREETSAHIIFLTSNSEHDDKIRGLDMGGDDYITKPYKLDELCSRVHAAIRRRDMKTVEVPMQIIVRGPLALNTVTGQAILNGEDLVLKPKEFALLRLLAQSKDKRFTARELYKSVWGYDAGDDIRTVQVHISNLRKKLNVCPLVTIEIEQRKYYWLNVFEHY